MVFGRENVHNTVINIENEINKTEIIDILSKEMTKEKHGKDESK